MNGELLLAAENARLRREIEMLKQIETPVHTITMQDGTRYSRSVSDKLQDHVSVFDIIPRSEHAAIRDGTSTYDSTAQFAALVAGVADGATIEATNGLYNGHLLSTKSLHLDGHLSRVVPVENQPLIKFEGSYGTEVEMLPPGTIKVTDAVVNSLSSTISSASMGFNTGLHTGYAIVVDGVGLATRLVTTLSVNASIGADTFTVPDVTDIVVGMTFVLVLDNGATFASQILSITPNVPDYDIVTVDTIPVAATLISTTVSVTAPINANSVTLTSVAGIVPGMNLGILLDDASIQGVIVDTVIGSVVSFADNELLLDAASAGNAVIHTPAASVRKVHRPLITTISSESAGAAVMASASYKADNMTGLTAWMFPRHLLYGQDTVAVRTADLTANAVIDPLDVFDTDSMCYIWDNTQRADGNLINEETFEIKSVTIDGDHTLLTFYDRIDSPGYVNFPLKLRKIFPVENPSVCNFVLDRNGLGNELDGSVGPGSHDQPLLFFIGCRNPYAENGYTFDNIGHAVRFQRCIRPRAHRMSVFHPAAVTSGEGYGVTFLSCRHAEATQIYGIGTRHLIDNSGSYDTIVRDCIEDDAASVPFVVEHNGFGSLKGYNLRAVCPTYLFVASGTELLEAQTDIRVTRDSTIEHALHIVPEHITPQDFFVSGYYQHSIGNVHVRDLRVQYKNTTHLISGHADEFTSASFSALIRVNGVVTSPCSFKDLGANVVGTGVYLVRQDSTDTSAANLDIDGVHFEKCAYVLHSAGNITQSLRRISARFVAGGAVIKLRTIAGISPAVVDIDPTGWDISTTVQFVDESGAVLHVSGLRGTPPEFNFWSTSGLTLPTTPLSTTISIEKMIYASRNFPIAAPVAGTVTLDGTTPFPKPIWLGQRCRISLNSIGAPGSRADIIVPAGSVTFAGSAQFPDGKVIDLVAISGRKWAIDGEVAAIEASAALNFGAPAAVPGAVGLTISVPGAALGDVVVGISSSVAVGANYLLLASVTAANTVTVRWFQHTGAAADPDGAGATYTVRVRKA